MEGLWQVPLWYLWKTYIVSYSRSTSAMSFCRLAWKEEVVYLIEALID